MRSLKRHDIVLILMFTFFIMFISVYINRYFTKISIKEEAIRYSKSIIIKNEDYLNNVLANADKLIRSIGKSTILYDYLYEPSADNTALIDLFSTIVRHDKNIMQLRYINKEGFEEVRVHRLKFGADTQVPLRDSLQDKSKRYYFQEAKQATKDETIYSKLDLNIEKDKLEIPFNPTLRLMLPLRKEGVFNGVLVINYFMEDILTTFADVPDYDVWVVDSDGYPILHADPKKNWQRYVKGGQSIQKYFQEDYKAILNNIFVIGDDFVSRRMQLPVKDSLSMIIKPNQSQVRKLQKQVLVRDIWVGIVVLIIISTLLMITYLYQRIRKQRSITSELQKEKETLAQEKDFLKEGYEQLKAQKISFDDENNPFPLISQANVSMTITGLLEDDTPIIYVNESFTKMTGYSLEEVRGKNPRFLQMDDREQKALKKIKTAMENEEPIVTIVRNYTKEGKLMYIELSIAPIYHIKTRELLYFFALQRDVSTEQRILHDLKSMF